MQIQSFDSAIRPHVVAWMAGEISADQSLLIQWKTDLSEHRAALADCRSHRLPISAEHHQRQAVRAYINIRRSRRAAQ